jgi:hypothetical protein
MTLLFGVGTSTFFLDGAPLVVALGVVVAPGFIFLNLNKPNL